MEGIQPREPPLANCLNKTLEKSELPREWKDAMVTPIYEKRAKSTARNYRPVRRVTKFAKSQRAKSETMQVMKNELLTSSQHGCVAGKSCTTQLT